MTAPVHRLQRMTFCILSTGQPRSPLSEALHPKAAAQAAANAARAAAAFQQHRPSGMSMQLWQPVCVLECPV